jgi:DNA recombination protein RmuC
MSMLQLTITLCAIAAALIIGALLAHLRAQQRIATLQQENASLYTTLELERKIASERLIQTERERDELDEKMGQKLGNTFADLSSKLFKDNSEQFLKLAQEKLQQFNIEARNDLGKKEQAIEHLLKPMRETLEKTEKQLHALEQDRKEAYGSISKHLESMTETQRLLQDETRNLSQALRRPEVRGQWGELTLKRLVELAGMVQHCDFFEQQHTSTDSGAIRPDMIVRMPGNREIVVDVKTPLDAYLSAVEARTDKERNQFLEHHARKVRERVRELSSKAYWSQFTNSPDFVVLFIPGDQFLSAALDKSPDLLEYALEQKVILATPSSLIALLRAVAYGWNQQSVAENAEQIRNLGADLFKRLNTFTSHLARVGKHLNNSVENYNSAVGSFERQVLSGARKFTEMGISAPNKTAEPLVTIEKNARTLSSDSTSDV